MFKTQTFSFVYRNEKSQFSIRLGYNTTINIITMNKKIRPTNKQTGDRIFGEICFWSYMLNCPFSFNFLWIMFVNPFFFM